jgi:hypothetical protein
MAWARGVLACLVGQFAKLLWSVTMPVLSMIIVRVSVPLPADTAFPMPPTGTVTTIRRFVNT